MGNLTFKCTPLKKTRRVHQKIDRSYGGDASRVLDFVRSSIGTDSIDEASCVLKLVLSQAKVLAIKNRYDEAYNGKATGVYRDINLHLCFDELAGTPFEGYVFEVQIILNSFLQVKTDEGHARYVL